MQQILASTRGFFSRFGEFSLAASTRRGTPLTGTNQLHITSSDDAIHQLLFLLVPCSSSSRDAHIYMYVLKLCIFVFSIIDGPRLPVSRPDSINTAYSGRGTGPWACHVYLHASIFIYFRVCMYEAHMRGSIRAVFKLNAECVLLHTININSTSICHWYLVYNCSINNTYR